jgi:hypothetical protein
MSTVRRVLLTGAGIATLLALPIRISASNESVVGLTLKASDLCAEESGCPWQNNAKCGKLVNQKKLNEE